MPHHSCAASHHRNILTARDESDELKGQTMRIGVVLFLSLSCAVALADAAVGHA
jgi:hypothetical protein